MPKRLALPTFLAALVAAGCGQQLSGPVSANPAGEQMQVVATTGMVGDAVEAVGGDRIDVTTLMGPGLDPHVYKASEGDVIELAEADAVFYNGLHLEAKLADVFERMRSRVPTYAVAEEIPPSRLLAPPGFSGAHDPHVWFDVRLWMKAVERVRSALSELDPEGAPEYRRRAAAHLRKLATLDRYVRRQAQRVPARQRVLITAHDAFNYFGRAYGFEVRGLQGISTVSEAGTGDVRELADFIAERRIPAIYVESSVSPRAIEAVREAVRSRGFDVRIGGQLFSDALGEPGTQAGTYPGMVRHNVDTIVGGLLGDGS
jgi:manganese/zinc/iron transport system substrate-binding protein